MDGRNLFVMYVYHTEDRGIIINSLVLPDFPLDRLVTGEDLDQVKDALLRASAVKEAEFAASNSTPVQEVSNVSIMNWRWMDRPAAARPRSHRRNVRV